MCPSPCTLYRVVVRLSTHTALPLWPRKRARGRGVLQESVRHRQRLQGRALLYPSGEGLNERNVKEKIQWLVGR